MIQRLLLVGALLSACHWLWCDSSAISRAIQVLRLPMATNRQVQRFVLALLFLSLFLVKTIEGSIHFANVFLAEMNAAVTVSRCIAVATRSKDEQDVVGSGSLMQGESQGNRLSKRDI